MLGSDIEVMPGEEMVIASNPHWFYFWKQVAAGIGVIGLLLLQALRQSLPNLGAQRGPDPTPALLAARVSVSEEVTAAPAGEPARVVTAIGTVSPTGTPTATATATPTAAAT